MATNKHAVIRYEALDKCFSNTGKKFFLEDIIDYVSNAMQDYMGSEASISRRQIFKDMDFMRSEAGFRAPIVAIKEGRKKYYRYDDPDYLMSASKLNPMEAELIKKAMDILSRFKGLPTFDFITELSLKLQKSFQLQDLEHIMLFDQNEYLKNINYIADLLKAIQDKNVLEVSYKPFNRQMEEQFILHPYFLKQYNKRWFLFGQRADFKTWSNLAVDRIVSFKKSTEYHYIYMKEDAEEYFEDIIGVSKPVDRVSQTIKLRIANTLWPYIDSKPLHPSQKVLERSTEAVCICLDIIPNYEFYAQILGFGPSIEVQEPLDVRAVICRKLKENLDQYER